jgi:UDP-N-acetylmuramyl pentapeptide phosphotransferase/UDP-N-acetylglucosamine-1-phosphate transferase
VAKDPYNSAFGNKAIVRFWIASLIFALFALTTLKLR